MMPSKFNIRVLASMLIVALVLLTMPSIALADETPKITRAEWIHELVQIFEVTVEDESYPEDYFSDVSESSPYYEDLVKAVEFGILDVPLGGAVNADGAATREFSAHTLNFCLGFQLQSDEYTFSDVTACAYPADDQVAVNRGWMALDAEAFDPDRAITEDEYVASLTDADEVWNSTTIDPKHKNSVVFDAA